MLYAKATYIELLPAGKKPYKLSNYMNIRVSLGESHQMKSTVKSVFLLHCLRDT